MFIVFRFIFFRPSPSPFCLCFSSRVSNMFLPSSLANELFQAACHFFLLACSQGVLVTMENPKNSYFWWTKWVKHLLQSVPTYTADFHVYDGWKSESSPFLFLFSPFLLVSFCLFSRFWFLFSSLSPVFLRLFFFSSSSPCASESSFRSCEIRCLP